MNELQRARHNKRVREASKVVNSSYKTVSKKIGIRSGFLTMVASMVVASIIVTLIFRIF